VKGSRLVGAAGGAAFSVLALIALLIAPGPSSAGGRTVVTYFATHASAVLAQAVLFGFGAVCFIWFVEALSSRLSTGHTGLAAAAVGVALLLVAIGAWESLAETFRGVDPVTVSEEAYGDAHVLFDVGTGAAHLANFANAAFLGTVAVAMIGAGSTWRRWGVAGAVLAAVELVNAPLQLLASSHWSDLVGVAVFGLFLLWILAVSIVLTGEVWRERGLSAPRS
jgi:hypothetical protein